MSKKVFILSTSLRNKSNSQALAEAFAEGALAVGNEVELVSLKLSLIHIFCLPWWKAREQKLHAPKQPRL